MSDHLIMVEKLRNLLRIIPDKGIPPYTDIRSNIRKHIDLELNAESLDVEINALLRVDPKTLSDAECEKALLHVTRLKEANLSIQKQLKELLDVLNKQLEQLHL